MDTKTTYTHRVAIMETRQIIMDIEAPNDLDSIKEGALSAYFLEYEDQEVGLIVPTSVIIYPWLEEGQTPPNGYIQRDHSYKYKQRNKWRYV